jgi:hypothetical protein
METEIIYDWKITFIGVMDEATHSNAIVQTRWEKTGTDVDGNVGIFAGATPFTSVNVPANEFIPIEQLQKETVLNWIKGKVVDDYELHVNLQIINQINASKNPIREIELL